MRAQSLLLYMAPIAATLLLPFTVALEGNVIRHVSVLAAEEPCASPVCWGLKTLTCIPPGGQRRSCWTKAVVRVRARSIRGLRDSRRTAARSS